MKKEQKLLNFLTGVFVLLGFILFVISFSFNSIAQAEEVEFEVINEKQKLNFTDDSVIVVLDPQISAVNKIHDKKFFRDVEIDSITDLTRQYKNWGSPKSFFKQILKINLKEKKKENVLVALQKLKKVEGILSVEPNYCFSVEVSPSDTYYVSGDLWGMNGTNGIEAPFAWDIAQGSDTIRVGVIDTGIANHNDLNLNLGTGWDTFNNNNITTDDTHSHGTHVSGTIGAVGNNSIGVVGVNWTVQLIPLQAANADNMFYSDDVIEAISWAEEKWGTSEQIDVINYSVSGFGKNMSVQAAISNYHGLFIWASGNDGECVDVPIRAITIGKKKNDAITWITPFGNKLLCYLVFFFLDLQGFIPCPNKLDFCYIVRFKKRIYFLEKRSRNHCLKIAALLSALIFILFFVLAISASLRRIRFPRYHITTFIVN